MNRPVIGISVGSQNTVVGVLKGSVIDIILSETSSRCVPTLTAYNDRERSFGDAAFSTIKSNYSRTITYPNRYLGLKSDSPFLEEEKKYATALPSIDQNGKVMFEIDYKGEKEIVYPETAMGIYFNKLKLNWIKAGYDIRDVVVSVPDYYTVAERKAMIEALNIADLNCTALINESSSVALAYGWFKRTQFEENPRIVGFIDMGQSKTTITYVSFTKTMQKVISVTTERNCGAREFDLNLAKFFSDIFKNKHGLEPIKSVKIKLRMMDAISKTRKILTVNKEATLSIESLMDDEDLNHLLTRIEFEKIISSTVENFKNVIKKSLINFEKDTKMSVKDLHSIEMIGDAIRTPCIQEAIKDIFKMDLGKSLMPDECMARGSTLFAAMNSPFFSFKDFNIEHFNFYSIFIEYPFFKDGNLEVRINKLISRGENIPNKKSIKFTEKQMPKKEVLTLKFFYNNEEYDFTSNPLLNSCMISIPNVKEEQYQLIIQFLLDNCCIPHVDKATINETYFEEVLVKKDGTKENKNQPEAIKTEKVKKERNNVCMVKIAECNYGNPNNILNDLISKEANQNNDDNIYKITIGRRNEIENNIYSTRIKMNDELAEYISSEERAVLPSLMDETENWLYSGDESVYDKKALENKCAIFIEISDTIYGRFNNWKNIFQTINLVDECNASNMNKLNQIYDTSLKNYLNEEDIFNLIANSNKSLNELKTGLLKSPKFMDPPVLADKIKADYNELNNILNKIYNDAENKQKEKQKK